MFRQDAVSGVFVALAVCLALALRVWGLSFDVLFVPILLLFGSAILLIYSLRHRRDQIGIQQDKDITKSEGRQILFYALLALASISIGAAFAENVFLPKIPAQVMALSLPFASVMYAILMAISETLFFQGTLLIYLKQHTKHFLVAILLTSIAGVFYHVPIYGTSVNLLLFVLLGYTVLSWVSWKTRRNTSSMLAHIGNNAAGTLIHPLLVLGLAGGLLLLNRGRKGGIG